MLLQSAGDAGVRLSISTPTLLLGVPSFFSTFFLVESLRAPRLQGHSAIVYAVSSAAGVILAFVAGSVFWKEPLTARNRLGVAVAVTAVALPNLG